MQLFRIAVLSVLAGFLVVSPAAAQSAARKGSQLPSEQSLNRQGLTRSWWSHATINSRRDKLAYMVVDETHLFLQATSGTITAFDTETGKYLWTKQIGAPDRAVFEAVSNDTLLFVVNGLRLFAVKKDTGDVKWQLQLPGMPASSPAADEQQVYVGFVDGSLYAFDLKKTEELFAAGMLPQYSESTVVWRYRTSKSITTPAVPGDVVVAFASRNGSLYSVTKDHRKLVFQFETDAALSAPIIRYRNNLLLASEDSNFYSLEIHKGTLGWQFTAGTVIKRAPVLVGDDVYLFPEHGNMFKLSAQTGIPAWSVPRIQDFLSASSTRVYVTDNQNNLVILSADHGEPLGKFPLGMFTRHLANERSDRIYVATEAGLVMCLHERGREFARFHMHPDRQPILPEFAPDDDAAGDKGEPAEATEDMPADGEKPEAEMKDDDKPDAEMKDEDKPEAEADDKEEMKDEDKPGTEEGDKAEKEEMEEGDKPAADKSDDEEGSDEKPEGDKPEQADKENEE
jgi:outer membrane protein assembly factor BamB